MYTTIAQTDDNIELLLKLPHINKNGAPLVEISPYQQLLRASLNDGGKVFVALWPTSTPQERVEALAAAIAENKSAWIERIWNEGVKDYDKKTIKEYINSMTYWPNKGYSDRYQGGSSYGDDKITSKHPFQQLFLLTLNSHSDVGHQILSDLATPQEQSEALICAIAQEKTSIFILLVGRVKQYDLTKVKKWIMDMDYWPENCLPKDQCLDRLADVHLGDELSDLTSSVASAKRKM